MKLTALCITMETMGLFRRKSQGDSSDSSSTAGQKLSQIQKLYLIGLYNNLKGRGLFDNQYDRATRSLLIQPSLTVHFADLIADVLDIFEKRFKAAEWIILYHKNQEVPAMDDFSEFQNVAIKEIYDILVETLESTNPKPFKINKSHHNEIASFLICNLSCLFLLEFTHTFMGSEASDFILNHHDNQLKGEGEPDITQGSPQRRYPQGQVPINEGQVDLLDKCRQDLESQKDLYQAMVDYFVNLAKEAIGILQRFDDTIDFIFQYSQDPNNISQKFSPYQTNSLITVHRLLNEPLESIRSAMAKQKNIDSSHHIDTKDRKNMNSLNYVAKNLPDIIARMSLIDIVEIFIDLPSAKKFVLNRPDDQPAKESAE